MSDNRGEIYKCALCGQPVVSVCNDLDLGGNGVTCHYEPATEDEKAKRIAELEAEFAASLPGAPVEVSEEPRVFIAADLSRVLS